MNPLTVFTREQYALVKGSRNVVFEYCRTIAPEDFIRSHASFGNGESMSGLLSHVLNTYEAWIAHRALGRRPAYLDVQASRGIEAIIPLYERTNRFMQDFIDRLETNATFIDYEINGKKFTASPL